MTDKNNKQQSWMYDENIGASYDRFYDPIEDYYYKRGELAVIDHMLQPTENASPECIEYYEKHLRKFCNCMFDEDGMVVEY